jgi:hypothetical protein
LHAFGFTLFSRRTHTVYFVNRRFHASLLKRISAPFRPAETKDWGSDAADTGDRLIRNGDLQQQPPGGYFGQSANQPAPASRAARKPAVVNRRTIISITPISGAGEPGTTKAPKVLHTMSTRSLPQSRTPRFARAARARTEARRSRAEQTAQPWLSLLAAVPRFDRKHPELPDQSRSSIDVCQHELTRGRCGKKAFSEE